MTQSLRTSSLCVFSVLFLVGSAVAAGQSRTEDPKWTLKEGQAAPDFVLQGIGSGEWKLSAHRGTVVMIDFWATWCAPCLATLPEIDALRRKFRTDEAEIVSVSIDPFTGGSIDQVREFLTDKRFAMPILAGDLKQIGSYVISSAGGQSIVLIPNTYIIDRSGIIRLHITGGGQGVGNDFEDQIRRLLKAR